MDIQEPESDRLGVLLPKRALGGTGCKVTMLGTGGAHVGRADSESEAQAIIEAALDGGVRFFDTAQAYQNGRSEERYGRFLTPRYRDLVFLMTKSSAKDAATAETHLKESLRRLKTDCLDLWQMHSLKNSEDVDTRVENGVLDVFERAKADGKVKHIGFTGHSSPHAHTRMLERTDIFETAQMPVNCADSSFESFILNVLPVLVGRQMGVIAMKTLSNGGFFGGDRQFEHGSNPLMVPDRVSIPDALRFAWSQPISVLVTGPDNAQQMHEKIRIARAFEPMNDAEKQLLVELVSDRAGNIVKFYKVKTS